MNDRAPLRTDLRAFAQLTGWGAVLGALLAGLALLYRVRFR